MRILYVVHQFFPKHYTGTERFILNLSKQMQKVGHYVKVLAYSPIENDGYRSIGNLRVKEYQFQGIPVLSVQHRRAPPHLDLQIYDGEMERFTRDLLSKESFDLIHIGHPMKMGSVARAAKDKSIPIVLTLTDFWLICPRIMAVTKDGELCSDPEGGEKCKSNCFDKSIGNLAGPERYEQAKDLLQNADFVAAPSHFLADVFMNLLPIKVFVVRHGTLYSGFKKQERNYKKGDAVVFGYIGTVLPHKGVHIAIEAMKFIKDNIKLKIYGHYFNDQEYFDSLNESANGDSRIEFLGEYRDESLLEMINEIDCMLVPSIWWENSPLTILTSLAYKVPVITIDRGGSAELVKDDVNGFNFKMGNAEDLAKKMQIIADDPGILNKLKENIIRPPRVEDEAFIYENIYRCFV